jgi:hypothetical protein
MEEADFSGKKVPFPLNTTKNKAGHLRVKFTHSNQSSIKVLSASTYGEVQAL